MMTRLVGVGVRGGAGRGMSSALATEEMDDGKLPLKGLRVLDMTRVLAGVCLSSLSSRIVEVQKEGED